MSALRRLLAALEASPEIRPGQGSALIADLLNEEADHLAQIAPRRGPSWAAPVRRGIRDAAEELRSRAGADPGPDRLEYLRQAMHANGGEWTPSRAKRLFEAKGAKVPQNECRHMLIALYDQGAAGYRDHVGGRRYFPLLSADGGAS